MRRNDSRKDRQRSKLQKPRSASANQTKRTATTKLQKELHKLKTVQKSVSKVAKMEKKSTLPQKSGVDYYVSTASSAIATPAQTAVVLYPFDENKLPKFTMVMRAFNRYSICSSWTCEFTPTTSALGSGYFTAAFLRSTTLLDSYVKYESDTQTFSALPEAKSRIAQLQGSTGIVPFSKKSATARIPTDWFPNDLNSKVFPTSAAHSTDNTTPQEICLVVVYNYAPPINSVDEDRILDFKFHWHVGVSSPRTTSELSSLTGYSAAQNVSDGQWSNVPNIGPQDLFKTYLDEKGVTGITIASFFTSIPRMIENLATLVVTKDNGKFVGELAKGFYSLTSYFDPTSWVYSNALSSLVTSGDVDVRYTNNTQGTTGDGALTFIVKVLSTVATIGIEFVLGEACPFTSVLIPVAEEVASIIYDCSKNLSLVTVASQMIGNKHHKVLSFTSTDSSLSILPTVQPSLQDVLATRGAKSTFFARFPCLYPKHRGKLYEQSTLKWVLVGLKVDPNRKLPAMSEVFVDLILIGLYLKQVQAKEEKKPSQEEISSISSEKFDVESLILEAEGLEPTAIAEDSLSLYDKFFMNKLPFDSKVPICPDLAKIIQRLLA